MSYKGIRLVKIYEEDIGKLKTTKTFIKGSKTKNRNPKNEDHIEKYNIW